MNVPTIHGKKGFTLIELLIVVAIIAILAAIAVPNFLEAQVRAKVSREKNDLRTMATAIESYMVDYNSYPRDSSASLDAVQGTTTVPEAVDTTHADFTQYANGMITLTTPVSFINTMLTDPFGSRKVVDNFATDYFLFGSGMWSYPDDSLISDDDQDAQDVYDDMGKMGGWIGSGLGPDGAVANCGWKCFPYMPTSISPSTVLTDGQPSCYTDYDPTNGTSSIGDVYRFGGSYRNGRWLRNGGIVGQETPIGAPVW
jgi:prepilin-type N-terminal cleavage/methylation domain-containing protein